MVKRTTVILRPQKKKADSQKIVVGSCSACKGDIVLEVKEVFCYRPDIAFCPNDSESMRRHKKKEFSCYCDVCGSIYKYPLPEKKATQRRKARI